MNSDLVTSLRRTIIPVVVGWLLAQALKFHVDIDEATLTMLVTSVYYAVVRLVEERMPKAGLLLGKQKKPTY